MIRTLPEQLKTESSLQINQTVYQTSAIIEKCRHLLTQSSENDVISQHNSNLSFQNYFGTLNKNQTTQINCKYQQAQSQQKKKSIIHLKPKGKRLNATQAINYQYNSFPQNSDKCQISNHKQQSKLYQTQVISYPQKPIQKYVTKQEEDLRNKTKQDRFNHYISQLKLIEQQQQKMRRKRALLKDYNRGEYPKGVINDKSKTPTKGSVNWNSSTIKKNQKHVRNRKNVSDLSQLTFKLFSSSNRQQFNFGNATTNKKKQRRFTEYQQDSKKRAHSPQFSINKNENEKSKNHQTLASKNQEGHTIKQYSKYGSFKMSNPFKSSQKSQNLNNSTQDIIEQDEDNIITADFCRKKNKQYFGIKNEQNQCEASGEVRNDSFQQTMLQFKRKKLQQEQKRLKIPIKKSDKKVSKKVQSFYFSNQVFNKVTKAQSPVNHSVKKSAQKSKDRSVTKTSNLNKSFESSAQYSGKSKSRLKQSRNSKQKQKNEAIDKMKNYKFVERYMNDYQLQQLYNKYKMAGIPEFRWSMLIIDEVYKKIKSHDKKNV